MPCIPTVVSCGEKERGNRVVHGTTGGHTIRPSGGKGTLGAVTSCDFRTRGDRITQHATRGYKEMELPIR